MREDERLTPCEAPTLARILALRALETPDRVAYAFVDGDGPAAELTYGDLDRRSRAVAASLRRVSGGGDRALVLLPPGLEFVSAFFGCLYAGAVAVPLAPPRGSRGADQARRVAADARPAMVLASAGDAASARVLGGHPALEGARWLDPARAWADPDCRIDGAPGASDPATVAVIQYTSGSTASPRGVVLTNANLTHNLSLIHGWTAMPGMTGGVFWLPPYHDMGLIGGILQHVYSGIPLTMLSPAAFVQRPMRWLELVSQTKATYASGPNFAYDLCVKTTTPEARAALDLSSWRVAFNGAEPVCAETVRSFAEAFAPSGFRADAMYPCYGLAEATLIVAGGPAGRPPSTLRLRRAALERGAAEEAAADDPEARTLVSCGAVAPDQTVLVVDPETCAPLPDGTVGEIWVSGPSVARGYWDRPAETERAFRAQLAGGAGEDFLRTGDLGFMRDGELFVAGRIKDVVVLRGLNYYPDDIERAAGGSHELLRREFAAAFAVDVVGRERLVVALEVERRFPAARADEVIAAARAAIGAAIGVTPYAVLLVGPKSLARTQSGKIRRHMARAAFVGNAFDVVGAWYDSDAGGVGEPRTRTRSLEAPGPRSREEFERWLVREVASRTGGPASEIDPALPFSSFGVDSLHAVQVSATLSATLGRQLPATLFWDYPTIDALAEFLASAAGGPADGLLAVV